MPTKTLVPPSRELTQGEILRSFETTVARLRKVFRDIAGVELPLWCAKSIPTAGKLNEISLKTGVSHGDLLRIHERLRGM